MNKTLLIVAAHPDDEILGCGGTVARLVQEGWTAYTHILGEGATSRDVKRDRSGRLDEIGGLKNEMALANKRIGVTEVFTSDFADNRFDSVDLLDIVKEVERVKSLVKPSLVFTHYAQDLNIDHKICYQAVLTATRPLPEETVKQVLSFEILSSTEWNYPSTFSPNCFYDITSTLRSKVEAMDLYKNELREFPHPRSLKAIEANAQYWGVRVGLSAAESFVCVRDLR